MVKLLVYLAIVLLILAVAQLARVFELASELKGGHKNKVTERDNRNMGRLFLVYLVAFFAFIIWQLMSYGPLMLPEAASVAGKKLDWLFNFNMIIIFIVFVITHILLFFFAFKYYGRDNNRATFFPHNNKLELLWTSVPAAVLAVIIFLGLKLWNEITTPADDTKSDVVEIYTKQFDFTIRYAGTDNKLGRADYKRVIGANVLGLDSADADGHDDKIVKELHLPCYGPNDTREVSFKIRSQDVIHSVYFPYHRAQMNSVPGMTTLMHFKPTITTAEMRTKLKNDKFDYYILCNKICGTSHYTMKLLVVVETPEEYKAWLAKQPEFMPAGKTAAVGEGVKTEEAPKEQKGL
ncbi:MAG: cytochrome c oxidase subunit II [Bacteroidia bacterium]